jgi:hypothetical protein
LLPGCRRVSPVQRHRTIAAAPVRSAYDAWAVICDLIADSLSVGAAIDRLDVIGSLSRLDGLGPLLIAGGHLERDGLTIRAAALDLVLSTASGMAAIDLEENLNVVPGAATATTWDIYVPASEPHVPAIEGVVAGDERLHVGPPPASHNKLAGASPITIDLDALNKAVN